MRIAFIRSDEHQYFSTAVRDDGVTVRVPGWDRNWVRKRSLPHDLAHCTVERELGLGRGFWGSVAAGALFGGMTVLAGRRRTHAAERSQAVIKQNGLHILQAEVLVGAFMEIIEQGLDRNLSAAAARVAECQSAVRLHAVRPDQAAVARVCAALREAESLWRGLAAGGEISVGWDLPYTSEPTSHTHAHRRGHHATRPHHRARGRV